MGLFSFLQNISDSFFESFKQNALDDKLKKVKHPPKTKVMTQMDKLQKERKELDDLLKDIKSKTKLSKEQRDELKKSKEKDKKNKENEKKNQLISKYGKEIGTKLFKKQLFVDMSYEMLKEIKPRHDKKTSNVSNGKETIKLYYGKKKNRLGNDSFKLEVTLKDNKVVGWKDLSNVGTRSK